MSRRQPTLLMRASNSSGANFRAFLRTFAMILTGDLRNGAGVQAFQELARAFRVVFGIGGKHDQEKTILARQRKARDVEVRVVRHGQTIQREHAEHRRDAAEQNRHLERYDDERWPGVIGTATYVDGVANHRYPDRKSTRLNSSHLGISYAVFCL